MQGILDRDFFSYGVFENMFGRVSNESSNLYPSARDVQSDTESSDIDIDRTSSDAHTESETENEPLPNNFESPEDFTEHHRVRVDEWAHQLVDLNLDLSPRDQWKVMEILDRIGQLPKMAGTIQRKNWYHATIALVCWSVQKFYAAKDVEHMSSEDQKRITESGELSSKWFLFGGPVSRLFTSFDDFSEVLSCFTPMIESTSHATNRLRVRLVQHCQIGKTFVVAVNIVIADSLRIPHFIATYTASTHVADIVSKASDYVSQLGQTRNSS